MFYIIYETTNLINDKKYIGKHQTTDINDGYLGSGLALKNAINKYGKDNFERKTLFVCDSVDEMNDKEIEFITSDIINSNQYYNISYGGQGGAIVLIDGHPLKGITIEKIRQTQINQRDILSERAKQMHAEGRIGMHGKKQSEKQKTAASIANKGKVFSEEHRSKLSAANKGKPSNNKGKTASEIMGAERAAERFIEQSERNKKMFQGAGNPMHGKKHSDEAKRLQSEKAKQRPKVKCVCCGFESSPGMISRWHNNNCKNG